MVAGEQLTRPPSDATAQATRGKQAQQPPTAPIARVETPAWFQQLKEHEWSNLDAEIQRRVKHMTPDEIPALEHKAKGGNVIAQTTLGLVYRDGIDKVVNGSTGQTSRFKANNTLAIKWIKSAAHAGFAIAQTELGEMYFSGKLVRRDLIASRSWLEKASVARYPRAKIDLVHLDLLAGRTPDGVINLLSTFRHQFHKETNR